jgi:cell division protein FtsX
MTKGTYSNTSQTQKVAQKSNHRPKNRKPVHKHLTWTESLKQALLLISKMPLVTQLLLAYVTIVLLTNHTAINNIIELTHALKL